jgi:membrane protein implicated in regulation of membrane protease activity
MPGWLKFLLIAMAVVILGPPAMVLALAALGVAVGLTAMALKVGLFVLAIYALVLLVQAIIGPSKPEASPFDRRVDEMHRQNQELDEELARAVAAARK